MNPALETPRALALVGMPGAGKSICAQHLADRGFYSLRFGAVVVEEARRRGLAITPENERIVREQLRSRHGMAAMAVISLPKLRGALSSARNIVIDGLYSFSEYRLLRQELGAPLILLAIAAPRQLRYRRLARRPVRPLTPEQAETRDIQEIERLEKGGPIAMADFTLLNDRSPIELLEQLDALLTEIGFLP